LKSAQWLRRQLRYYPVNHQGLWKFFKVIKYQNLYQCHTSFKFWETGTKTRFVSFSVF
jgi:hypothetical protein